MKYDFIISGAGIAGLTSAITLQRIGYRVKVLERNKELKEVGAGIGLGPNTWKALEKIGIDKKILESYCNPIKTTQFLDTNGKILSDFKMRRITEKYGVASFAIHRANLLKILLNHLGADTIELGKKVIYFQQHHNGVRVFMEDGDIVEGNALIAADGIHSSIRKSILPNAKVRYSGYTCWRAVIKVPNYEIIKKDLYTETWGANGRFGIIPLTDSQIYWYACVNASFQSKEMSTFSTDDLAQLFKDYHTPIPDLIKRTKTEELIQNDIIDLKPINHFAFDKVLLIGDAAHATTPNLGQGASQAITDAIILSKILNNTREIGSAFKKFERQRKRSTKRITHLSWLLGIAAQLNNRTLINIRNAGMKFLPTSIPEKQLESIYKN